MVTRRQDLATPALTVDGTAFSHNVATMAALWPGARLRPHAKAFKSTALAKELAAAGHRSFCAATAKEIVGLARAGLGEDLLLANETVDASRLVAMASAPGRVTIAVDSAATVEAAARAGIREVLIDVDVGCLRCGCEPVDAGALAKLARAAGLGVRGVMGYEGQLMMADPATKADQVASAMAQLATAHADVGGAVVSGGGTGTCKVNRVVTELQAGSYALMDADYLRAGLGFRQALHVEATVVSVHRGRWAVADSGLKALGMDHGNPTMRDATVVFCSDEHTTFVPEDGARFPAVGDRVQMVPAHLDPTISYHETMAVLDDDDVVVDSWPIDLRNW